MQFVDCRDMQETLLKIKTKHRIIHRLKLDVYHWSRPSSQLISRHRFHCFWKRGAAHQWVPGLLRASTSSNVLLGKESEKGVQWTSGGKQHLPFWRLSPNLVTNIALLDSNSSVNRNDCRRFIPMCNASHLQCALSLTQITKSCVYSVALVSYE